MMKELISEMDQLRAKVRVRVRVRVSPERDVYRPLALAHTRSLQSPSRPPNCRLARQVVFAEKELENAKYQNWQLKHQLKEYQRDDLIEGHRLLFGHDISRRRLLLR